ncbi:PD-(D/E)XK motif protein [Hoeflea sp.]|uniref:PD-(D/E)XK motif protein n=1 Tax=Hoeflea sp. TaxID=1940281 RepID=UPI003B02968A
MTSGGDPWLDILPATGFGGRIERRADPEHPADFYRARLPDGRYLFLLKNIARFEATTMPALAGIDIRIEDKPDHTSELILELADNEQVSLFRALTRDFLDATADLSGPASDLAARRIMIRLQRWQAMLRRRRSGVLSRQAIIGLTGELLFLRDRLLPYLGVEQTLRAWRGPHRDEQDFAIGDHLFEVKTQLNTADQYLQISSEAQLDVSSGKVVVCHQTLVSGSEDGESLNQLVEDLWNKCQAHSLVASDFLEAGLLGAGFQARPEYDEEKWKLARTRVFEVIDDFPRLVPSQLPPGVSNVSYRITLGTCERFERTPDWFEGVIRVRD